MLNKQKYNCTVFLFDIKISSISWNPCNGQHYAAIHIECQTFLENDREQLHVNVTSNLILMFSGKFLFENKIMDNMISYKIINLKIW